MQKKIRNMLTPFASLFSLNSMVSLSGRRTIFLLYHIVTDERPPHIRNIQSIRNIDTFREDLEFLLGYFKPVSIGEYLEGVPGSREKCMVLTFDDGLSECHDNIVPVLKEKGIPAVFFVNNDFIDNRGLFYRYKASLLMEEVQWDREKARMLAGPLGVDEAQVTGAINRIPYSDRELLDRLAILTGFSYSQYQESHPVYMSGSQIRDLIRDGFDVGSHSFDHPLLSECTQEEISRQIGESISELSLRFSLQKRYYAFPFTSDGIPSGLIDSMLNEGIADAFFGISGLKRTHRRGLIHRIPVEDFAGRMDRILKTEYFYYLLKAPIGRNRYK